MMNRAPFKHKQGHGFQVRKLQGHQIDGGGGGGKINDSLGP